MGFKYAVVLAHQAGVGGLCGATGHQKQSTGFGSVIGTVAVGAHGDLVHAAAPSVVGGLLQGGAARPSVGHNVAARNGLGVKHFSL